MDNPETQAKLGTRHKTKTQHRKHKKASMHTPLKDCWKWH